MMAGKPKAALIAIVVATVPFNAWPQVVTQESVEDIWIHQVPGPPQGDFWDPIIGNLFNVFGNPASIYPDVVACGTPAGGREVCTSVCQDVQGEGCQTPLRLTLPQKDSRLRLRLWEIDPNPRRPIVAHIVPDPAECNHTSPCTIETPRGPLVVSFGTVVTGTSGTVAPPAPPPPSSRPEVSVSVGTPDMKLARVFAPCTAAKAAARTPPCGAYRSSREASWAALDMAYLGTKCSAAIGNEIEFAGYIYSFSDSGGDRFSFLGPFPGAGKVADYNESQREFELLKNSLKNVLPVAAYHSHPSGSFARFSLGDLCTMVKMKLEPPGFGAGYVVGPDGDSRKFTPNGRKFDAGWTASYEDSFIASRLDSRSIKETWYDTVGVETGIIERAFDVLPAVTYPINQNMCANRAALQPRAITNTYESKDGKEPPKLACVEQDQQAAPSSYEYIPEYSKCLLQEVATWNGSYNGRTVLSKAQACDRYNPQQAGAGTFQAQEWDQCMADALKFGLGEVAGGERVRYCDISYRNPRQWWEFWR